ncbi:MAG TPA: hypothetical protein VHR47_02565 [Bacillota bacterium]|nr:hypothetical protein [Bacillota bacterium]
MAYRILWLLFSATKKVTKKVAGTWRFPEFPLSLKAVLKRPTVHGFEYRGNVDALRVAYSLRGLPGRDSTVVTNRRKYPLRYWLHDGAKHRPFRG